jgi:hypothetical protein
MGERVLSLQNLFLLSNSAINNEIIYYNLSRSAKFAEGQPFLGVSSPRTHLNKQSIIYLLFCNFITHMETPLTMCR